MDETISIFSWLKDLFSAVRQVLLKWINSYRLFSKKKIEAGTLNFRNIVNNLYIVAIDLAQQTKPAWINKNSFRSTFTGKKANSLQEDALDKNNKKTSK